MTTYHWVKLVHIISATVLFGTGMGTAFFMLNAYLSKNAEAMAVTSRHVVTADWLFTTPAVVIQVVTGVWLMHLLSMPFTSTWFAIVFSLYLLVGALWIPVVWIQLRVRDLANAGEPRASYERLMTIWIALGVPAFASVIILFYLMVTRIGAYD